MIVDSRGSGQSGRGPVVALALGTLAWALLAAGPLYDSDGWWHLRTGEWILDHGRIPRSDPFSWTAAGADWQPNSWLFDVGLATLYRVGGLVAISLYKSATVVAIAFATFALARRAGAPSWPSALSAFGAVSAIFLFLAERPQSLSYILFAAVLVEADRALRGANAALLGLAVLLGTWANLHGVFVTGVAVIAVTAAGHAWRERRFARAALVALVSALAGLANVYGIAAFTHAADVRRASQGIREWQHFDPLGWPDRPIALFATATVVALARTGRWRRPDVLFPIGVLAALTFDALRSGPFLVVASAPELALGVATIRFPAIERRRAFAGVALIGWATVASALTPFALSSAGGARSSSFPTEVVHRIPPRCRILNEYSHGGYIGWSRPDLAVSQDSRNDVFGPERLHGQEDVLNASAADRAIGWIDGHHVDCVVARHGRPLLELLARNPRWRAVADDGAAALVVRIK